MPKYKVELAKTLWATIEVEAEDEERAIGDALAKDPRICAQCSGWGKPGVSVSDDDDWLTIDEFLGADYKESESGHVVTLLDE